MPASKAKQFTIQEQSIAILGRALSHPARVRILSLLTQNGYLKNKDLSTQLKMSKTAIHNHIKKLEDAELISIEFYMNCFMITKSPFADFKMENYFNHKNF